MKTTFSRSVAGLSWVALFGACSAPNEDGEGVSLSTTSLEKNGACPPSTQPEDVVGRRGRLTVRAPAAAPEVIVPWGDGVSASTELALRFMVSGKPGTSHGPFDYFARYVVTVANEDCAPVRVLSGEVAAPVPGEYAAAVAWDGRGARGDILPAGTYYYGVSATYLKRQAGVGVEIIEDSALSSSGKITLAEVTPTVTCVQSFGAGQHAALLGYVNPLPTVIGIPAGAHNRFEGVTPETPLTVFEPGEHPGSDWVEFSSPELSWRLGAASARVSSDTPACDPDALPSAPDLEPPPGIVDPIKVGPLPPEIAAEIVDDSVLDPEPAQALMLSKDSSDLVAFDEDVFEAPFELDYTPRFCFKLKASYVDSQLRVDGQTEYWVNGPRNVVLNLAPAHARFTIDSLDGVTPGISGVLDRDGCYDGPVHGSEHAYPSELRGRLVFHFDGSFAGPSGDTWRLLTVPEGRRSIDGVHLWEEKQPQNFRFDAVPVDDTFWGVQDGWVVPLLVNESHIGRLSDVNRVAAIVSQVVRTPDNGATSSGGDYLIVVDDGCPSRGLERDSCVADGVLFVGPGLGTPESPSQARWKYVIAHELGHIIQLRYMGILSNLYTFTDGSESLNDPPGTPPLCRCDHVTVANQLHCLQSVERSSAAQVEGFAQFYASRAFNNERGDHCVFGYYKEFLAPTCPDGATCTPHGDDVSIFPPVPLDCKNPAKWRNRHCPHEEYSTEYDWMGFFYSVNTDAMAPVAMADLFEVYNRACTDSGRTSCWGVSLTWSDLQQAAEAVFGATDPRALHFTQSGDAYGVSTDTTP